MIIKIPKLSLVVLVGASGSGKSTFAAKHFKPTEILSSDFCRGLVADDENAQHATNDAFDVLHYIAGKRHAAGRLTVVDATSVKQEDRQRWLRSAASTTACRWPSSLTSPRSSVTPATKAGPTGTSVHTWFASRVEIYACH